MRGIVDNVRTDARRVDAIATELYETAADVADAERVRWRSVAADRWQAELASVAAELRHEAAQLEGAAQLLRAHARAADDTLDAVERARHRFLDGLDRARQVLAAAVDGAEDAVVDAARATVDAARRLPSTWSMDWLSFRG